MTTRQFTIRARCGLAKDLDDSLYFAHQPSFGDEEAEDFQRDQHREEYKQYEHGGVPPLYLEVISTEGRLQIEATPVNKNVPTQDTVVNMNIRDHHTKGVTGNVVDRIYAAMDGTNPETVPSDSGVKQKHEEGMLTQTYEISALGLTARFHDHNPHVAGTGEGSLEISHPNHGKLYIPCSHGDKEQYSTISMRPPVERHPELFRIDLQHMDPDQDILKMEITDSNNDATITLQTNEALEEKHLSPDQHALISKLAQYLSMQDIINDTGRFLNPTGINLERNDFLNKYKHESEPHKYHKFPGLAKIRETVTGIAQIKFDCYPKALLLVKCNQKEPQSIRPLDKDNAQENAQEANQTQTPKTRVMQR